MVQQELEQDINLMPYHQEFNRLASSNLEAEQVPREQGDTDILGDNLEGEMHNISFDESQHRVVQSCRVSTPDDSTSLAQFEERVIVFDVRKHPTTLVDATRAYAEATSSSFHFFIAENEQMAKEL